MDDDVAKPVKGTTTLAFIFNDGILVAVDSRGVAKSGRVSDSQDKVFAIDPYTLATMAGQKKDCRKSLRSLTLNLKSEEKRSTRISAAAASQRLADDLATSSDKEIELAILIAGWDDEEPALYRVTGEGTREKGKIFSAGSGSRHAYGILNDGYRENMSLEEAAELARRAIYHSSLKDKKTGGAVNIFHVRPCGWSQVSSDHVDQLHGKYNPTVPAPVEQEVPDAAGSASSSS